jgi:hypothetical protein
MRVKNKTKSKTVSGAIHFSRVMIIQAMPERDSLTY